MSRMCAATSSPMSAGGIVSPSPPWAERPLATPGSASAFLAGRTPAPARIRLLASNHRPAGDRLRGRRTVAVVAVVGRSVAAGRVTRCRSFPLCRGVTGGRVDRRRHSTSAGRDSDRHGCRNLSAVPSGDPLRQRPELRLAFLEQGEDRGGHKNRGVGAGGQADKEGEGEVFEGTGAEQARTDEKQRGDREQCDDRGVDGPDEGLVHGEVRRLAVGHPAPAGNSPGILPDLVENNDGVIQRISENGQQTDHRRRGDVEADQGVDAHSDDEVVQQRNDRADRHLPFKEQRQVKDDRHQKDDQALDRLIGDLFAPTRPDGRRGNLVGRNTEFRRDGLDNSVGRGLVQGLGLHLEGGATHAGPAQMLDDGIRDTCAADHVSNLGCGVSLVREGEFGTTFEFQAEVQPADAKTDQPDDDDDGGEGEPAAPAADEVEGDLPGVQAMADRTQLAHRRAFPRDMAAHTLRAGTGRCAPPAVPGSRVMPRCAGSRPENRWPLPKKSVRLSNVTSGLVKAKTMKRSTMVERPRVKANPRTSPTASQYKMMAAIKETRSAETMVRRARNHPFSTALRSELPSRTSSRNRSKNTTNESAVTPTATMRPAIPASVRV